MNTRPRARNARQTANDTSANSAAIVRIHSNRGPGAAPFEVNYNNKPLVDFLHPRSPGQVTQWLHRLIGHKGANRSAIPPTPAPGEIIRWRLKHPAQTAGASADNLIEFHSPNAQQHLVSRTELLALQRQQEHSGRLIERLLRHRTIAILTACLALGLAAGVMISHLQTNWLLSAVAQPLPSAQAHRPEPILPGAAITTGEPAPEHRPTPHPAQPPTRISPMRIAGPKVAASTPTIAMKSPLELAPAATPAATPADTHLPGKHPESAPEQAPSKLLSKTIEQAVTPPSQATTPAAAQKSLKHELQQQLDNWAQAWSAQDIDSYLARYRDDYQPPASALRTHRLTHRQWQAQRRQKLAAPESISVHISDLQWRQLPKHTQAGAIAKLRFTQSYRSDSYQDRVEKAMTLTRDPAGEWKISAERTIRRLPRN